MLRRHLHKFDRGGVLDEQEEKGVESVYNMKQVTGDRRYW